MAQSATKFVISQLSQEPFNLDLNVIAFNKLQPTQLLQVSLQKWYNNNVLNVKKIESG